MGYRSHFRGTFQLSERPSEETINRVNNYGQYNEDYDPWEIDGNEVGIYGEEIKGYDRLPNLKRLVSLLDTEGITVNGEVEWEGEEHDDFGIMIVKNNVVYVKEGYQEFHEPVLLAEYRGRWR